MEDRQESPSLALVPAVEPVDRVRLLTMLRATTDALLQLVPPALVAMARRLPGPLAVDLRSTAYELIEAIAALPPDDLAIVLDRVRWELQQVRSAAPEDSPPLSEEEQRAFSLIVGAIRG